MSDNEDLLGDDLGDHSLADYNLGNEEEEQLLADDYDTGASQNVPIGSAYREPIGMVPNDFPPPIMEYSQQMTHISGEPECVVPNITVEIPNTTHTEHSTYAPYEPPVYDESAVVPPAIPAAPMESPQIVPSEILGAANGDVGRPRFVSERTGPIRTPQQRNIPDTLDKVVVPRGAYPQQRGRSSWRNPHYQHRPQHPYRRNNAFRGNFTPRPSFPPPQLRPPNNPPQMSPEGPPGVEREMGPERSPERHIMPPERQMLLPEQHQPHPERSLIRHDHPITHQDRQMHQERPMMHLDRPLMPSDRPMMHPDRPIMSPERPMIHPDRPMMPQDRPMMPQDRPMMHQDRPMMHQDRPMMNLDRPMMNQDRPMMNQDRPMMNQDRPMILQDRPMMNHDRPMMNHDRPMMNQDRPIMHQDRPLMPRERNEPMENRPYPHFNRPFQPMEEANFGPNRPNFDRPMFYQRPPNPNAPPYNARPFGRDMGNNLPQVNIPPLMPLMANLPKGNEPEVRMLPVRLPPNLPPGGLAGKKVLINPHFKGTFQPPIEGLPTYIPTRIQKSPPLSPTLKSKFGPIKDIDDAAERFIAEQRNALARAATRKFPRRSPQRYIENTTIEIENDLARRSEDELLRRQEEFINANRAGLRRRMRSPSPPRRSPSPRRPRPPTQHPAHSPGDEESEYKKKLREQESLRERVLRAKEVRRRKNAVALQKQLQDRENDRRDKDTIVEKPKEVVKPTEPIKEEIKPTSTDVVEPVKPDTTRKTPERIEKEPAKEKVEKPKEVRVEKIEKKERERSPIRVESAEANSTCETLTPPRAPAPRETLTPPLNDDDELELILGDIDGILSDEEDSGRFKETQQSSKAPAPGSPPRAATDLRSRLPARGARPPPRQKIVFTDKEERRKKDKSPIRRTVVNAKSGDVKKDRHAEKVRQTKPDVEPANTGSVKSRQKITFDSKQTVTEKDDKKSFTNRRVILQRNVSQAKDKADPTQPNPGIFSRAVRTAIANDRVVRDTRDARDARDTRETRIEFESGSDDDALEEEVGSVAAVTNLPHGMTDTRLTTLAGGQLQSLVLNKEDRSAKIVFKTTVAAETFKKKFNNKMVAASRLTVSLR